MEVDSVKYGLKALKKLRELRELRELIDNRNEIVESVRNEIDPQNSPEIYYVSNHPDYSTQVLPRILRPISTRPITYKSEFMSSDRILQVNSANCAFKILPYAFYKIEISDVADPLINEVIFTKELTDKMESGNKIFPKYLDHFLLNKIDLNINKNYVLKNTPYKVLVTEVIQNPVSLYKLVRAIKDNTSYKFSIIAKINKLMSDYEHYGKTLGFIHSDLHTENIQVEYGADYINGIKNIEQLNFKIIDFGRCFMFSEDAIKNKYYREKETLAKFNLGNFKLHFSNDFRLVNIYKSKEDIEKLPKDDRKLAVNCHICENDAYLCDFAQVSLNLLISGVIPNKPWFKLIKYDNCDRSFIYIDLIILYKQENLTKLDHGLIWLCSYLISCVKYIFISITNESIKNLNIVFGKTILLDSNADGQYKFDLDNTLNNTLLAANSMFNPMIFSKNEKVQLGTFKIYKFILEQIKTSKKGGNNKNLKIKSKNKDKMLKGGLEEVLSESGEPQYYVATEEQLNNTSKSIIHILFEELEKDPGKFDELFNKLECKSCPDLEVKSCIPCAKAPLITKTSIRSCATQAQANFISQSLPSNLMARGGSKSYIIHTCRKTKRKYIRRSNSRWYLDENRGKYKYLNTDKKNIVLK